MFRLKCNHFQIAASTQLECRAPERREKAAPCSKYNIKAIHRTKTVKRISHAWEMLEFVLTALPFEKLWTRRRIIILDDLSPVCDLARLLAASASEKETWEAEDLNQSFRFPDCWPRCCLVKTRRMSGNVSLITLPSLFISSYSEGPHFNLVWDQVRSDVSSSPHLCLQSDRWMYEY